MSKTKIITLTTDFGFNDPFAGIMKGVMLEINPLLKFVDLTHEVESYNIAQAAYLLGSAYAFFPNGVIHLIVVDPGVGSERAPILVISDKYCFIAPDNGALSVVLQKEKKLDIYALEPERFTKRKISSTFHGRDIFAPAAALFSRNPDPDLLGRKIKACKMIDLPNPIKRQVAATTIRQGKPNWTVSKRKQPEGLRPGKAEIKRSYRSGEQTEYSSPKEKLLQCNSIKNGAHSYIGEIVYIDRFGNLISNFSKQFLDQNIGKIPAIIKIGSCKINGLKSHYAEADGGEVSALINSRDNLEIFLPSASAKELLNAKIGDIVEIEF